MGSSSAPQGNHRINRAAAAATAALLGLAIAGCGSEDGGREGDPTDEGSSSASATPTEATPSPELVTLEELAEDPCSAINDMDAFSLGGLTDSEESEGDSGKTCNWEMRNGVSAGIVVHLSESAETAALDWEDGRDTGAAIEGHTVIQEEFQAICFTVTSAGPNQSFAITTIGGEELQSSLCPLGTAFAELVLSHLQTA